MADAKLSLGERALRLLQRGRPDPLTSVVLTVPVFLTYHLGILLIDKRNGVDLVSELTFRLLEQSVLLYVGLTLLLTLALLTVSWFMRRRGRVSPADPALVVAESLAWASIMLVSVGTATQRVTGVLGASLMPSLMPVEGAPSLATAITAMGPFEKLVMAAGAGFHEEIVFRVALVGGGAAALMRVAYLGRVQAFAIAVVASSLAFAVVHHIGPLGDPLAVSPLVFRTFAGVFLSVVYLVRGFAVAVYTHTLYDVLVFFIL